MKLLPCTHKKKWIILLITLLIISIEPASAVEMGITMDTPPTSFNSDAVEYDPIKDYTTVQEDSIEYRKLLQDAPSGDAVETPSLNINPSHNDVEGYYPESRTDYEKEVDASKPITVGVVIAAIIVTVTVLVFSGGGEAVPPIIEDLARLGQPAAAPGAGAGSGCAAANTIAFTENELLTGATALTTVTIILAAGVEYGTRALERIKQLITTFINRVGTNQTNMVTLVQNLGTNAIYVALSRGIPLEAQVQLFLGMNADQQVRFLKMLKRRGTLQDFVDALGNILRNIDPEISIQLILALHDTYHINLAGEFLTYMIQHGYDSYVSEIFIKIHTHNRNYPKILINHMFNSVNCQEGLNYASNNNFKPGLKRMILNLSSVHSADTAEIVLGMILSGHIFFMYYLLNIDNPLQKAIIKELFNNLIIIASESGNLQVIMPLITDLSHEMSLEMISRLINDNHGAQAGEIILAMIQVYKPPYLASLFNNMVTQWPNVLVEQIINAIINAINNDANLLKSIASLLSGLKNIEGLGNCSTFFENLEKGLNTAIEKDKNSPSK